MAKAIQDPAFLEKWGPTILLFIVIGAFASALFACLAVATALHKAAQKELARWGGMAGMIQPQVGHVRFTTEDYIEKTTWYVKRPYISRNRSLIDAGRKLMYQ